MRKRDKLKTPKKYIVVNERNRKFDVRSPLEADSKINGSQTDAKIVEEDDFTYILWKNKKYNVQILEKNQNKYHVLLNGVSYHFTVETPISYKRRKYLDKNKEASKIEYITAPMPGKIVEIAVDEGAKVNAGEPVLTLEAMKMQNEIVSHVTGTIKSIKVKPEDLVMKEDILIEIVK